MKPLVTIITVNYQQPRVTCELLDSINQLSYPRLQTIVVDNGQKYDDTILYKHHLPTVRVINSESNLGFAGANNLGIKKANGEYIFLVNNDTVLEDGTIEQLLDCLKDKSVGAVSPILRYFDNPQLVQYAGFTEINPLTGRNSMIKDIPSTRLADTSYFHGAAVMLPKRVIDECGLMPEAYFLYYEELDWSKIVRDHGYQLKVCTETSVLHKESITTGKDSPLKTYYQTRNRVVFMNKHAEPAHRLVFNLFFHGISLPAKIVKHAIKGRMAHISALLRASYHASIQKKMGMSF